MCGSKLWVKSNIFGKPFLNEVKNIPVKVIYQSSLLNCLETREVDSGRAVGGKCMDMHFSIIPMKGVKMESIQWRCYVC